MDSVLRCTSGVRVLVWQVVSEDTVSRLKAGLEAMHRLQYSLILLNRRWRFVHLHRHERIGDSESGLGDWGSPREAIEALAAMNSKGLGET